MVNEQHREGPPVGVEVGKHLIVQPSDCGNPSVRVFWTLACVGEVAYGVIG